MLRQEMQHRFRALLGPGAQDEQTDLRVDVFGALMIGLTYVRHVLGVGSLADASPEEVARTVVPVARAILAPGADGGTAPVACSRARWTTSRCRR